MYWMDSSLKAAASPCYAAGREEGVFFVDGMGQRMGQRIEIEKIVFDISNYIYI